MQQGSNFVKEGAAQFVVKLTKPAAEDITVMLSLETSAEDIKNADKSIKRTNVAAPAGLLSLSATSVVIKKGAYSSDKVSVAVQDENKLLSIDDNNFVAAVHIKPMTAAVEASSNHGVAYVYVTRNVVYIKPGLGSIKGMEMVPQNKIEARGDAGNLKPGLDPDYALDGRIDPTPYGEFWELRTTNDRGDLIPTFFYFDFKQPVDLTAIRLFKHPTVQGANHLREFYIWVSQDSGNTWMRIGHHKINTETQAGEFWWELNWKYQAEAIELYSPIKGATNVKLEAIDRTGSVCIAEMEFYTKM